MNEATPVIGGDMRAYAKAIVSALVSGVIAFLSALLTALQGEGASFATLTDAQWVTAVLAFFVGLGVAGGVTYRVPNRPPAGVPVVPVPVPAPDADRDQTAS